MRVASMPAARRRLLRSSDFTLRAAARFLPAAAALVVVLLVHGLLPGLINDNGWNYLLEGNVRCLSLMGTEALTSWCNWYGLPSGYPLLSGGPIVLVGWVLVYGLGLSSYAAYLISISLFHALALAGAYGLLRALGTNSVVALGAAVAYLVAPTVVGMSAFGGTFTGYALLPAYALADVWLIRAVGQGGPRLIAASVAGYAMVRTVALFMDGYAFVVSAFLGALLWLAWLGREPLPVRRKAYGIAAFVLGNAVAYALYTVYTPEYTDVMPLDFFRSMGLDIASLVQPTAFVWGPDLLGLTSDHSDLWGDGTNNAFNYLGFVCVTLAIIAVVTRFRERHVAPFAVGGLLALVFALGPSIKVGEIRPAPAGDLSFQSYLMPERRAAVDLPWGAAYTAVPAFNEMRAPYRWIGLTRLALIVLAALAIDRLARTRRRRILAFAAGAIAFVELMPNVPALHDAYRANYDGRRAVDAHVVRDLQASTQRGERALFLDKDGLYIDYMANYLAASMEVRAFNAGGDKNSALARASWPQPVAVAATRQAPDDVNAALREGGVGVVIAPYFNLRMATYTWPPPNAERDAAVARWAPILEDPRFQVRRFEWFATVRLR